jgi:hypothetical protein
LPWNERGNKTAVEATPGDPSAQATPTVTHYDEVAANFGKALEELLAIVPHFVAAHPSTKGFARMAKTVSDEFLVSTIAAVEETPGMLALDQFDVSEARDFLQYSQAFRPMRDKLVAAATNVDFSINLRRANVVNPALQAYVLVKGLARNPDATLAASHAGNLRRDLGRAGQRKKKPAPKPSPAPTPVPPVSAAPAKGPVNQA